MAEYALAVLALSMAGLPLVAVTEHIEGTALQQRRFEDRTAGVRRCPDCHRWGRHTEEAHTVDVGHVHVLTKDGACTPTCPHPDHRTEETPNA